MPDNRSVKDKLRAGVHGLGDGLDLREYKTTDGVRHPDDYRIAVENTGRVVGDLCVVDRYWYERKCTNKAEREHRDEWVARTIGGIKLRGKR